jgi:hypothetical protein
MDDIGWENISRFSEFGFWAFLSLYPNVFRQALVPSPRLSFCCAPQISNLSSMIWNLVLLKTTFEVSGMLEALYVRIYDLAWPRSPAQLAGSSRPGPPDLLAPATLINSS